MAYGKRLQRKNDEKADTEHLGAFSKWSFRKRITTNVWEKN